MSLCQSFDYSNFGKYVWESQCKESTQKYDDSETDISELLCLSMRLMSINDTKRSKQTPKETTN